MSNKESLSSLDIRSSIFHSPTIDAKPWSLVCSLHWTHWIVLQMLCLHLIKMQFVVLCNSVLLRSGTNDCWTMSSSYVSVRTNTQRCFWDPLVGDRTLWNKAINVGTGISGSSNRQTLDPITNLGLTGTTGTWKAHHVKQKDWRTDLPPIGISTRMPLILACFPAPQWKSVRTGCFKELAKGHIPVVPPPIFYLSICLVFLYVFEVLDLSLSILNPYSSK